MRKKLWENLRLAFKLSITVKFFKVLVINGKKCLGKVGKCENSQNATF